MASYGQAWHNDTVHNPSRRATFKSPGNDMYLFILGAVVGNNMNYTISMAGLNDAFTLSYPGKKKQSTTTLSGLSLQTLPTGKEVTVWHSANTCSLYSTCYTMFYYSWGAFSLSGIMRHLVAYSATKLIHQPARGPTVKFDKDVVNTETFGVSNGEFTAGKDGLYYFSLGFLLFSPIQWTQLVFMKNGKPTDSVFQYKTGKEASQQIHASTMLALVKDDKITIDISSISTIKYLQCSNLTFIGFLYSTKYGVGSAWYFKKDSTTEGSAFDTTVLFDIVPIEYEMSYIEYRVRIKRTALFIKYTGMYFLQLSADCHCRTRKVSLYVNFEKQDNISLYQSDTNEFSSISSSFIIRLKERDILSVNNKETGVRCSSGALSFIGFLLYDEDVYTEYVHNSTVIAGHNNSNNNNNTNSNNNSTSNNKAVLYSFNAIIIVAGLTVNLLTLLYCNGLFWSTKH